MDQEGYVEAAEAVSHSLLFKRSLIAKGSSGGKWGRLHGR